MITEQRLKELLRYDPDTGQFVWIVAKGKYKPGKIAGSSWKGQYQRIVLDRRIYLSHSLAFLYMTGRMPRQIDHVDRNGNNNKWSNLREATKEQNAQNKDLTARNSSGYIGVYRCSTTKRWAAQVRGFGKVHWVGRFDTPSEAALARDRFAKTVHGGFAVLNFPEDCP